MWTFAGRLSRVRTLYRNARVRTGAAERADALLVEDAVIAWIGVGDDAPDGAGVTKIDLGRALVTPAFVDAHVHTTATGLTLAHLDLSEAGSLAELLAVVERAARERRGRPVLASGWDDTRWPERRPPTATELDRAGYGGAVYLARVDAHSAVVSSALLASVPGLAGLAGYRPDGHLTRAAHDAVRRAALDALSARESAGLQRAALRHAAELGIACVHEMAGAAISSAEDLTMLLSRPDAAALPEVIGYWGELFGAATARELGAVGAAGDLFCDGSLGSHTAALSEPYADQPGQSGMLRFETGELVEHIAQCTDMGLQAGFHAIGDAAVDQVLDAAEQAIERAGPPAGAPHRIEHAEYVRDPARLAASGLYASVQPVFDATWGGPGDMYATRLGPVRAGELNRFAALAAAGVPLAFGSDAPVTRLGPWAAVRAAVHPSDPANSLDPSSAFAAHTAAGWRAAGRSGSDRLAAGASATFAVWRVDELDGTSGLPDLAPAAQLPTCLATVRNGTVLYDAGILGG
jgi:predicted amidohydrolase YtcJ